MTARVAKIGKYGVRSEIVPTAYSTVYACFDPDLRTGVAIKLFDLKDKRSRSGEAYGEPHWRERFVREARLLAQIDHPHVIAVKELGLSAEGRPYFVMPLIAANLFYEIGREGRDTARYRAPARGTAPAPPGRPLGRLRCCASCSPGLRCCTSADLCTGMSRLETSC